MLTIEKAGTHQVDLTINGSIDADTMRDGLRKLLDLSDGMKGGRMLYTITAFKMPSIGALAVEFTMIPRLLGLLSRFDRIAVVTDIGWVATAADAQGRVLPGITLKTFPADLTLEAQAWLEGGNA
ncbi:STAS/SEC14 domain-containing protein [Rhizobiaceae bacterium]|nr:STAS/SEC14 domain-containing protein [Rhizobiaceae bacterium]